MKQTDHSNETHAIKLKGSVAITNVVKQNREPAHSAGLKGTILSDTIDTTELDVFGVYNHKEGPTLGSKDVTVGKKKLLDKLSVSWCDKGEDEN